MVGPTQGALIAAAAKPYVSAASTGTHHGSSALLSIRRIRRAMINWLGIAHESLGLSVILLHTLCIFDVHRYQGRYQSQYQSIAVQYWFEASGAKKLRADVSASICSPNNTCSTLSNPIQKSCNHSVKAAITTHAQLANHRSQFRNLCTFKVEGLSVEP